MNDAPMDMETAFDRLVDLAMANVEVLARKADRDKLAAQINRDAEIVRSGVHWSAVMDAAVDVDGGGFHDCINPPRLDLAAGAINVAMKTTTDLEIRPWLMTALDFLSGDYEPLECCETCQSNGEVVTDWNRYRNPEPSDKGDEAVAICPDCGGHP